MKKDLRIIFLGTPDFAVASLQKLVEAKKNIVAVAKTGMVCYDYEKKKIVAVPDKAKAKLTIRNGQ